MDPGRLLVTYCVVPRSLGEELFDLLRRYYQDDPSVRVVVERRCSERRREARRSFPSTSATTAPGGERRKVRSVAGRRLAERRALALPVPGPMLPRRARRYIDQLVFLERVEPNERATEDTETNRLILAFQAGDQRALELIYMCYFERIYGYCRLLLRSYHDAEDVAQQVFANAMEALPRYEVRPNQPFRFWLFRIARNTALKALARSGKIKLEGTAEIERRIESLGSQSSMSFDIDWLSDSELAILVERLPIAQRHTLVLRYALGLTTEEIAEMLERSPTAIRLLQHRALRSLEDRLTAIRAPRAGKRSPMRVRMKPLPVLGWRRFALSGPARPLRRV
jgi:RNA polymerase sigma-70 factor (ECF subfamily)